MSNFSRAQEALVNTNARQLALYLTFGATSLYILLKLLRRATHRLFPALVPGEPNTILLASPRADTGSAVTAKDLEGAREYDYIIVGGGTAGCVLANRLTEDPGVSVLMVESGHSDLKQIFSRIPAGFGQLFKTAADYALATKPEKECKGREMFWPRGKMLSINAMMYNKGAPSDWDEIERLGNAGWGYASVVKYMRKQESFTPAAHHPMTIDEVSQHGKSGPWEIGYSPCQDSIQDFLDACADNGIPTVGDINSASGMVGATRTQTFIDTQGQRSSTAVAYLTHAVASRANLHIATGQTVTKIVTDSAPRAVGVEMSSGKLSPVRYLARARREVILSAGAVHTPHVLKLSGIGPAAELAAHSIPLVKDAPGVGANLIDHLLTMVVCESKKPSLQYLTSPLKSLPALIEWLRHGTGGMTTNAAEALGFVRTADRADAPAALRDNDRSSGPAGVDLELMAGPIAYIEHGFQLPDTSKNYFSVGPILLRPESRGTITLASASPFDAPAIDANYLSTPHDRALLTYGLRLARSVLASAKFKDVFLKWYFPAKDIAEMSDEQVVDFLRGSVETVYHPMGTARMGKGEDKGAVVDERLRVHGVAGLRIADASVFPMPLACHPCSPVVTAAEKAADLIKEDAK